MVSINRDSLRAIPAYKTQLRHVKKKQGTAYLPPTILGCWTIVEKLFWENFRQKMQMQNLGLQTSILEEFRAKIKILSPHDLVCQKFAADWRNNVKNL